MREQTDADLVGAALAGETEALCALVRRYQDYVYGVALGILADFDLALEAAQEAFLCACCDLSRLKDPTRFGAWLCGIARNMAFQVRRDRQRQQALAAKAAERAAASGAAPPAWQVAANNEERIHPDRPMHPYGALAPARKVVPGVEHLVSLLKHERFNVRLVAVRTVGAYLPSGDERVTRAMRQALDDPKHKVRHAAARIMGVPCPGCGRS